MSKIHSRTTNSILNFISSISGQVILIIMNFVCRTVFINTLGKNYLGINGLFSNILMMLSLAEFGVGSAILYKLYKPIAEQDNHRVVVLMKFYKQVYRIIGLAISILGLCLIPFLPILVKDYNNLAEYNINVILIFILYLMNSVSSYLFFAYKSIIVRAHQKEYLLNIVGYFFTIVMNVVQIIVLIVLQNFEMYVLIMVVTSILQNIAWALLSNHMYPYINEKTHDKLSASEIKDILKDCGALFLYKLNGVVLKATDNIILSAFIGLNIVGLYSNYYILYTTINSLFSKIFNSISHSLGNLHASVKENQSHEYDIFNVAVFISCILGGTACVGVSLVADELIQVWIGAEYIISQPFSILIGIEIYTLTISSLFNKYRTSMGLFQQARFRPIASMIINLIASIILVQYIGIYGVIIGTIFSHWTTFMWYDPMIVHKYGFKEYYSVFIYYRRIMIYTGLIILAFILNFFICKYFLVGFGWISVLVHSLICSITVPGVMLLYAHNKKEGRYILKMVQNIIKKVKLRPFIKNKF